MCLLCSGIYTGLLQLPEITWVRWEINIYFPSYPCYRPVIANPVTIPLPYGCRGDGVIYIISPLDCKTDALKECLTTT